MTKVCSCCVCYVVFKIEMNLPTLTDALKGCLWAARIVSSGLDLLLPGFLWRETWVVAGMASSMSDDVLVNVHFVAWLFCEPSSSWKERPLLILQPVMRHFKRQKFIFFKFRVLTLGSISTLWDPTWLPHPKINKHFLQHYYTQKRNMQRVFPICQFHGFVVYCPKGPVCITVVYKGVCEKSPESSHYMPLHFTAV